MNADYEKQHRDPIPLICAAADRGESIWLTRFQVRDVWFASGPCEAVSYWARIYHACNAGESLWLSKEEVAEMSRTHPFVRHREECARGWPAYWR